MPESFVNAMNATFGTVPDTTPSYDDVIVPFAYNSANLVKINEMFDAAGLPVTDEAIKAVQAEYKISAAFLHDWGDITEGLEQLKVEDLGGIWERAIRKIIRNIIEHGDANYDPVMECMSVFHSEVALPYHLLADSIAD